MENISTSDKTASEFSILADYELNRCTPLGKRDILSRKNYFTNSASIRRDPFATPLEKYRDKLFGKLPVTILTKNQDFAQYLQ